MANSIIFLAHEDFSLCIYLYKALDIHKWSAFSKVNIQIQSTKSLQITELRKSLTKYYLLTIMTKIILDDI